MVRRSASFYLGFETLLLVYAIISSFSPQTGDGSAPAEFHAGGFVRSEIAAILNRRVEAMPGLRFGTRTSLSLIGTQRIERRFRDRDDQ